MKFKIEKNLRIINELMACCYHLGSTDVNVHVTNTEEDTTINISATIDSVSDSSLTKLRETLNTQRQHEVEQYYWHLGGESEVDDELSLVGMMIDKAIISYESGILKMELIRNEKEAF